MGLRATHLLCGQRKKEEVKCSEREKEPSVKLCFVLFCVGGVRGVAIAVAPHAFTNKFKLPQQ